MNEKNIIVFCILIHIVHIAASLPWTKDTKIGMDFRVINGHDMEISQVPYQVAIIVNGTQKCGGSIINKDFILTAAHCIGDGDYKIRAGSSNKSSGGVLIKVIKGIKHPKFTVNFTNEELLIDYDIGIIQLAQSLNFTRNIVPAKLADKSYEVNDGDICVVTGWGNTSNSGDRPEILQGVEVPNISFDKCKKYLPKMTPRFICALDLTGGHNACGGDSGGPLTHKGTQVGIVSFGAPPGKCDSSKLPTGYTKVSLFRDWIDSVIN